MLDKFLKSINEALGDVGSKALYVCFSIFSIILAAIASFSLYKDCEASYLGWAKLLVDLIDMQNGRPFGISIAIVPTVIQVVWIISSILEVEILSKNRAFNVVAAISTIFDNALDIVSLTNWDGNFLPSLIAAIIVAVVIFTLLSEFIFSVFVPISIASLINVSQWVFGDKPLSISEHQRPQMR